MPQPERTDDELLRALRDRAQTETHGHELQRASLREHGADAEVVARRVARRRRALRARAPSPAPRGCTPAPPSLTLTPMSVRIEYCVA